MKKYVFLLLGLVVILLTFLFSQKKDTTLKTVKVAEVTHSIFYTPQYIALSEGYFEKEGLNIDLVTIPGADKVAAAVLSKDVQIGFSGPEATIYVYNSGEKDYLVNFAGLTKKDGSFLVSRKKYDNFKLEDLKGKYIIGGRKGGMPQMTLEWGLKKNNISLNDLTMDTSIAFAAMQGAFVGGTGDFVTLFEPNALQIEKQGLGYVVASVGNLGGEVSYTTYYSRKSYIEKNKDVIKKFNKALDKGIEFVKNNDNEVIAKSIHQYFNDISLNELTEVINRYKKQDSWVDNHVIKENHFNGLQEIMINSKELDKKAPYNILVTEVD